MIIDPPTLDDLAGRTFSNGRRYDLGHRGRAPRRQERLVALARGLRVLHVGCCDHLELIAAKLERGGYLHRQLCDAAGACVGVDTNAEGVARLRALGFPEVHLPDDAPDRAYDLCILADVIEHVGDVVSFLRSMRRHRFERLVVATPNAFRLRNFLSRGETVNTDHRHWFTPYTLCKVLVDAGYRPSSVELCHADHASARGAAYARLLDFAPKFRDSLIVVAERGA
jgi:2-polyprenyl-3-methyl-5-hydroxy-6-metoxy-1,4-benzoquinol methylase